MRTNLRGGGGVGGGGGGVRELLLPIFFVLVLEWRIEREYSVGTFEGGGKHWYSLGLRCAVRRAG